MGSRLLAAACAALALSMALPATAAPTPPGELGEPRFQSVGAGRIPRDVVPALAQDRDGFLWVATGDGLVRHDGHQFRAQERDSPDPAARNLGWVRALLAARDGRLWIGTEADGLAAYDPRTDRVTDFRSGHSGGALPTITALAEDGDGRVWVGTASAGLEHFDPAGRSTARHQADGKPGSLPDNRVGALRVDRSGTLWVGTWQGLARLTPGRGFEPVALAGPPAREPPSPGRSHAANRAGGGEVVQALLQASDGRLWVGTQQGRLHIVDPATLQVQTVWQSGGGITSLAEAPGGTVWVGRSSGIDLHDVSSGARQRSLRHDARRSHGLAGNEVASLLLDRAGSMWVAGYGLGLQRHEPGNRAIRLRGADLQPGSPFADADVRALLQRRDGEVWVALHRGGVVRMNAALQVQGVLAPDASDGSPLQVNALLQAADGTVWLGGKGELQQVDARGQPRRRLPHAGGQTHAVAQAPDGTLWVCTQDGLFRLPPDAPALQRVAGPGGRPLAGEIFVAAQAEDGSLWIGGVPGLFRVPPGSSSLQAIESDDGGAGLANPIVVGLLFGRDQTLWVDTAVTGLHRMTAWDGQRAQFDRVSARHGVFNRPFGASLLQDDQGRIWTHMYVYDPAGDKLHELTAADGVIFGTGWFRSHARLADGRLLYGGSRGLLVVQPAAFRMADQAPPLRMTALRIDGQRQPVAGLDEGLTLQPGQRNLSVEFAALEYTDPERNRYAYRLEGYDRDWTATGADLRVASYGNLAPGHYTLRVRATNRAGVWSPQELALPLHVLPAWWQHLATRVVAAVLLLLAALGALEWRTGRLRRQRQALEQAVAQRTAELEAERAALDARVQARTRELATATAAAEAANAAKSSFLHHVSHEMRTPLNAIIGLTQLQQRVAADEPQRHRLGQVGDAARQLLGLVNHVLKLSETGTTRAAAPAAAGAAADGPGAETGGMPVFHGERVLLAEDEAVNQIVATGILEAAGLQVDVAANGAQAVRMAAGNDYALILMDLQMPELDGLAATRAIRAAPGGQAVPIVALSAFAFDEDRRNCLDAGMNDHVSKPIDTAVLLQAVRRWLRAPTRSGE